MHNASEKSQHQQFKGVHTKVIIALQLKENSREIEKAKKRGKTSKGGNANPGQIIIPIPRKPRYSVQQSVNYF